jgi:hypothetical protein
VELHRMLALPVWSLSIFDEQARPRCKLTDERSPAAQGAIIEQRCAWLL